MGIPQIILIIITASGLGIAIEQHGDIKTGRENVWSNLVATIVLYVLLYFGGFFSG